MFPHRRKMTLNIDVLTDNGEKMIYTFKGYFGLDLVGLWQGAEWQAYFSVCFFNSEKTEEVSKF